LLWSDGRLRIYRGSSYFIKDVTGCESRFIVDEDMVGPVVDTIMAPLAPGRSTPAASPSTLWLKQFGIQVDARPNGTIGDRHYDHARSLR